MSQSDDMQAIHNFFSNAVAKTTEAGRIKSAWFPWYSGLSWLDINTDDDVLQSARARREGFFRANAVTEKEKKGVEAVINKSADKPPASVVANRIGLSTNPTVREPSAAPVKLPTIQLGSKGDAVKTWQKKLNAQPSGLFDKNLDVATRKWQAERGLKVDGVVGPNTWMASFVTDKSPAAIPVAVHDSTGKLPSASAAPVKKAMVTHVVEVTKAIVAKGKDVATADISKVKSEASMLPTVGKVGLGLGIGAGLYYAFKKFW